MFLQYVNNTFLVERYVHTRANTYLFLFQLLKYFLQYLAFLSIRRQTDFQHLLPQLPLVPFSLASILSFPYPIDSVVLLAILDSN